MANNIISSLGGGSGIDTSNLVTQLTELERAPQENRLNSRQEKLEAQISAYGTLKSAMSEFQSMLSPLANPDTFAARSVAFPDTDLITPNSLDPGAQAGSYQIEVLDVAQAQTLVMAANSDKDAALGASGELSIQFGTWTYASGNPDTFGVNADKPALNIEVEADDTLATLAEKINGSDSGVQASVMKVDDQYQLMLTAPSGEDNAMSVTGTDDGTGTDATFLQGLNFNEAGLSAGVTETQQGSDAVLKINGLEVRRETNEIDDVIDGFNFTVNKASVGESINFSVESDSSVADQAIRDFVEAYNSFYETAKNLTGYSKDENNQTIRGDLATDGTAKSLLSQLRSVIGSEVEGVESGFTALTNLGIRTELDGTLSINEAEFSSAMNDNFDLVADLFAQKTSSSSSFLEVGVGTRGNGAQPGSYEVVITQDPAKGELVGADIQNLFDTPLDTTGGGYTFSLEVNGVASSTITLDGIYNSAEELRADLQSLINGDSNLKSSNAAVDVGFDAVTGQFSFTSREYGDTSTVNISNQSASMDALGLGAASGVVSTAGQDVAGTINGEEGFGAGEVLLPALGSSGYGLNFTAKPGSAALGSFTVGFSRGMGGELSSLIDRFLASDGAISTREDNMDNQLDGIASDREDLDRRMEQYETRISAQFLAMERIISSLNATGDSLDGILDRLPFTAQNN
ncbi:flagellar filament capping protein FliD [Marinobacterium stanieri]|uniref:Flagellar hook-associated protein 2 n=1 Tax=Marinobacterium stanieri TaxID=49186 RepID=A0A1N6X1I9_9GAMM|nr:flagellar filament capping protein FliD [Marinobacterium stanieri]SIQ96193.1 flagellar hook-associated protein 2 [Marinobacterium stanieri]